MVSSSPRLLSLYRTGIALKHDKIKVSNKERNKNKDRNEERNGVHSRDTVYTCVVGRASALRADEQLV